MRERQKIGKNISEPAYVTEKNLTSVLQGFEPKCPKHAWLSHSLNFYKKVYFWSYYLFSQKSEQRKGLEPFKAAWLLAFSK